MLSTTTYAPASCAAFVIVSMSATSSAGLVGDSSHTRAASAHAATTASVSVTSTSRAFTRPRASRSASCMMLPLYACRGATTVASCPTRSSTVATAASPDEKARQRPPSSSPSAVSKAAQVGLP